MRLFKRLYGDSIIGFSLADLKMILPDIPKENVVYDTIIFSRDKNSTNAPMLKCIKNYYVREDMKKMTMNVKCQDVQFRFKIERCRPYDCTTCHLRAIHNKERSILTMQD